MAAPCSSCACVRRPEQAVRLAKSAGRLRRRRSGVVSDSTVPTRKARQSVFHRIDAVISFLDNRNNVFVLQLVAQTDSLRLVLHAATIHDGNPELIDDGLVNRVTKIFHSRSRAS